MAVATKEGRQLEITTSQHDLFLLPVNDINIFLNRMKDSEERRLFLVKCLETFTKILILASVSRFLPEYEEDEPHMKEWQRLKVTLAYVQYFFLTLFIKSVLSGDFQPGGLLESGSEVTLDLVEQAVQPIQAVVIFAGMFGGFYAMSRLFHFLRYEGTQGEPHQSLLDSFFDIVPKQSILMIVLVLALLAGLVQAYTWDTDAYVSGSEGSPAAETMNQTWYEVKSGDTLSKIAQEYGVTVDQLVEWNDIQDRNVIYPRQMLVIYLDNMERFDPAE